ncbi:32490_t:CDS:2 [Gigaspora margarita]|uniref:32490_t:CDS:1 n=1 Tax=Gigaspora margarita TaxID=4874 RepID=A0ABN7UK76_GIGMA|nr:32490_t:CDS:2 [Gigaspora margarita]
MSRRKTPRQKCNHCKEGCVDLIARLKEHLLKCNKLPKNIKYSLEVQDSDKMKLSKSDVDTFISQILLFSQYSIYGY